MSRDSFSVICVTKKSLFTSDLKKNYYLKYTKNSYNSTIRDQTT